MKKESKIAYGVGAGIILLAFIVLLFQAPRYWNALNQLVCLDTGTSVNEQYECDPQFVTPQYSDLSIIDEYAFYIHPKLNDYVFRVVYDGLNTTVEVAEITRPEETIQILDTVFDTNPTEQSDVLQPLLSSADYNFDGYADIRLMVARGATACTETYMVWLFNSETLEFEYNESLSALQAFEANPEEGTIVSCSHVGGAADPEETTYRWESGALVEVQ